MANRKLTKLEQDRKERTLLELNALGYSHGEIAVIEGYSSSKAVSRAINRARQKPQNADVMRADSDVTLDYISKKMVDILNNPMPQHTSIGRTMWNVTSCDCVNGGTSETRADHTAECSISPAINQANLVSAAKLIVKVDESRRKMHGVDKRQPMTEEDAMAQVNAFLSRFPVQPTTYRAEILEATEVTDDRQHADGHQDDTGTDRA